jgi:hypothetical protein
LITIQDMFMLSFLRSRSAEVDTNSTRHVPAPPDTTWMLQEHLAWIERAQRCAGPENANDIKILGQTLQHMIGRRQAVPPVLRAEAMDVLRRCGEDGSGLDPSALIRSARSLASCGQSPSPSMQDQTLILHRTIEALEKKNAQIERALKDLQSRHQPHPSETRFPDPEKQHAQPRTTGERGLWSMIRALVPGFGKRPQESGMTEISQGMHQGQLKAADLKTIMLTVQGQGMRSMFDVVSDWSSEKLAAKRVARAWAAGSLDGTPLACTSSQSCRFGQWLEHVEAPPGASGVLDDLRMWHTHWHALNAHWSSLRDASKRQEFAADVVRAGRDNEWTQCTRKIDGLLIALAKQSQQANAAN